MRDSTIARYLKAQDNRYPGWLNQTQAAIRAHRREHERRSTDLAEILMLAPEEMAPYIFRFPTHVEQTLKLHGTRDFKIYNYYINDSMPNLWLNEPLLGVLGLRPSDFSFRVKEDTFPESLECRLGDMGFCWVEVSEKQRVPVWARKLSVPNDPDVWIFPEKPEEWVDRKNMVGKKISPQGVVELCARMDRQVEYYQDLVDNEIGYWQLICKLKEEEDEVVYGLELKDNEMDFESLYEAFLSLWASYVSEAIGECR